MTSARLTISTASDRWRALRFNSRLSGGAKTTLPKLMPTNIQHTHNESLTYCTSDPESFPEMGFCGTDFIEFTESRAGRTGEESEGGITT